MADTYLKDELAARGLDAPSSKILRSAARGIGSIKAALAAVPTFTSGANNVASTINGAGIGTPTFLASNPKYFTPIGGPLLTAGGTSSQARTVMQTLSNLTRRGGHGSGVATITRSGVIDFSLYGAGGGWTIYVTDLATGIRQRALAADLTSLGGGQQNYYKLELGSDALRLFEFYPSGYGFFWGCNVPAGMACWAPGAFDVDRPKIAIVGDSWPDGVGSGNTNPAKLTFSDFLGERLGVANPICASVGSTGLLLGSGVAASGTFRQRIEAGDIDASRIGKVDAVIIPGSLNDNPATDAAVQAELTLTIRAARIAQPDAIIVTSGPQITTSAIAAQSRFDAMKAGALAANDANSLYLDNSPAGENWYYTGAAAAFIGPDGYHPNDAGMQYYGYRFADSLIAALRARL